MTEKINFEKFQVNEETREITFSCASDKPYQRYDQEHEIAYNQILVVDESAVNLQRLNNSAPLLFNHDTDNGLCTALTKKCSAFSCNKRFYLGKLIQNLTVG